MFKTIDRFVAEKIIGHLNIYDCINLARAIEPDREVMTLMKDALIERRKSLLGVCFERIDFDRYKDIHKIYKIVRQCFGFLDLYCEQFCSSVEIGYLRLEASIYPFPFDLRMKCKQIVNPAGGMLMFKDDKLRYIIQRIADVYELRYGEKLILPMEDSTFEIRSTREIPLNSETYVNIKITINDKKKYAPKIDLEVEYDSCKKEMNFH